MTTESDDMGITLSAGTVEVLNNMIDRVRALASSYGLKSPQYQDAAMSYWRAMENVLRPDVKLWPDFGNRAGLSLSGNIHGLSFGIIWHETKRMCTDPDCGAIWRESGEPWTWDTVRAPIKDHAHTWDIAEGYALPGTWSFHS